MKVSKDIAYAFHCSRCGGLTEPGKHICPWCSQDSGEYFNGHTQGYRVMVNGIYLNTVKSIGSMNDYPTELDATSLTSEYKSYITGRSMSSTVTMEAILDRHLQEQADFFNTVKGAECKVELPTIGSFEFYAKPSIGLPKAEVGQVLQVDIEFDVEEIKGWQQIVLPELICPNCGAFINFAYGCCPYCGGWVEWRKAV